MHYTDIWDISSALLYLVLHLFVNNSVKALCKVASLYTDWLILVFVNKIKYMLVSFHHLSPSNLITWHKCHFTIESSIPSCLHVTYHRYYTHDLATGLHTLPMTRYAALQVDLKHLVAKSNVNTRLRHNISLHIRILLGRSTICWIVLASAMS